MREEGNAPTSFRAANRWLLLTLATVVAGTSMAADWRRVDAARLQGIDGLIGDAPMVQLTVDAQGQDLVDIRLERMDAGTGEIRKAEFDEAGCATPWRHTVMAPQRRNGDSVSWLLTERMPPGTYAVWQRPSGSNAPWRAVGEPFWIVTQAISRVVPCARPSNDISIAQGPMLKDAQARVQASTVRVSSGALRGQGVVVNPWGHVVTSAALVGEGGQVQVGFPASAGGILGDRLLTYRPVGVALAGDASPDRVPGEGADDLVVLAPVAGDGVPKWFPDFAPLVDRDRSGAGTPLIFQRAGALYATSRGHRTMSRVEAQTAAGTAVPSLQEAGAPLMLRGALGPDDVGGPVFDHQGRVWGVLTAPDRAQWSTLVVERYLTWTTGGQVTALRGPLKQGG